MIFAIIIYLALIAAGFYIAYLLINKAVKDAIRENKEVIKDAIKESRAEYDWKNKKD